MKESNSIVMLTGDGPEHKYVANLICSRYEVAAIIVVGAQARQSMRQRLSKIFRRGLLNFLDKALWRVFLLVTHDKEAHAAALREVLGEGSCSEFREKEKVIRMTSPDTEELVRVVDGFHPAIIAVYGTYKIPDAVLGVAQNLAINMHTGISPFYRGTACAFWPIVENEPEKVGATVHECTSKLDGGAIFFSASATLYKGDNLHTIFARAVKVGAQGYLDVLRSALEGRLAGTSQDPTVGREYRGYMRGLRAELVARRNLARMRSQWDSPHLDISQASRPSSTQSRAS